VHAWILSSIHRSVPGGMRRHMELHGEGLTRLGHRATLLFEEDFDRWPASLGGRLPGARSLSSLLARCRREAPDVVNVHVASAPAWIAACRAGVIPSKVVAMSYAADEPQIVVREPRDLLRWGRAALPARATFRHASGLWCVNQQDAEYYVETYGVERARIGRFPHTIADSFFEGGPVARQPRQILFAGTWIKRKGTDVLGAALARVVREIPDVRVVLAGTQTSEAAVLGELDPEVVARTRAVELADDATLRELYQSSSLLVVPSRREGLPFTLLEAMATGCPALAAANSGMLDVIEPGDNGWLEVSFDPERWAARLIALLRDPAALGRASEGARRHAERFRIVPVAEAVVRWYEALSR